MKKSGLNLKKEAVIPRKLIESKARALKIAEIIKEKQAKDIIILDLRKISTICDYFVICSAESSAQVQAIYEETVKKCKKDKMKAQHYERDNKAHWMLADFFDVMLHVFLEEARNFYDLENLWSAAKKIKIKSA